MSFPKLREALLCIRLSFLTAHRTRRHLTTCNTDSLPLCGVLARPHRHRTRLHAYQSSRLPVLWRAVFVWWSRQTALLNIFIYCKLHRIRAVCGLFCKFVLSRSSTSLAFEVVLRWRLKLASLGIEVILQVCPTSSEGEGDLADEREGCFAFGDCLYLYG